MGLGCRGLVGTARYVGRGACHLSGRFSNPRRFGWRNQKTIRQLVAFIASARVLFIWLALQSTIRPIIVPVPMIRRYASGAWLKGLRNSEPSASIVRRRRPIAKGRVLRRRPGTVDAASLASCVQSTKQHLQIFALADFADDLFGQQETAVFYLLKSMPRSTIPLGFPSSSVARYLPAAHASIRSRRRMNWTSRCSERICLLPSR